MDALVLTEVGRFELIPRNDPEPGPGEVRLAITHSGICGSELAGFRGTDGLRAPGVVFGHEFVGVVEAHGAEVDAAAIPLGTPVTANPLRWCGDCRVCRSGSPNVCPNRQLLGAHRDGSNAGLVVVPAAAVHRIDHLPDQEATILAEPAACALRAVGRISTEPLTSALVIGAGPIGLLLLEVLRRKGVQQLFVSERNPGRRDAAQAAGAVLLDSDADALPAAVRQQTDGTGVDAVFDAVGSTETRAAACNAVRPGGDVCFVGLHAGDSPLPVRELIRREVTCRTSFGYSPDEFAAAVELLGRRELIFRGEVLYAPLADGQYWYESLLSGHPAAKVILVPEESR